MLHFNGHLTFGAGMRTVDTLFTSINNVPSPGATGFGYASTTVGVDAGSGFVIANPSHTYGDGTPLDVRLYQDGHAELNSGAVTLSVPGPDYGLLIIIAAVWFGVTVESALKARGRSL